MRLISVNVALPREVRTARGTVSTGIFKEPVAGPVMVRALNLDGDAQGDPRVHGGPDQAVYAYALEDYGYWEQVLGRKLPNHGWFGENLTIAGASSDSVCVADVLQVRTAVLQVTDPRIPCYKLEHKMGIPGFAATFKKAGRPGFYLRVLQEGVVQAGDEVRLLQRDPKAMTVRRMSDVHNFGKASREEIEQALRIEGLSKAQRRLLRKLLGKLQMAAGV